MSITSLTKFVHVFYTPEGLLRTLERIGIAAVAYAEKSIQGIAAATRMY